VYGSGERASKGSDALQGVVLHRAQSVAHSRIDVQVSMWKLAHGFTQEADAGKRVTVAR